MIFLLFNLSSLARAGEREVVGGDILHSATATTKDEASATFLAQQTAIKAVITECAFASKEIKIWSSETSATPQGFTAKAVAGISFQSCEEVKNAKPEKILSITSQEIIKNQTLYVNYIKRQLGIAAPPNLILHNDRSVQDFQHINERLQEILLKIDAKRVQQNLILVPQPASLSETGISVRSICLTQYRSFMRQAEVAALRNFPAGNLATGQAREFYNQAERTRENCR